MSCTTTIPNRLAAAASPAAHSHRWPKLHSDLGVRRQSTAAASAAGGPLLWRLFDCVQVCASRPLFLLLFLKRRTPPASCRVTPGHRAEHDFETARQQARSMHTLSRVSHEKTQETHTQTPRDRQGHIKKETKAKTKCIIIIKRAKASRRRKGAKTCQAHARPLSETEQSSAFPLLLF